jgi:competence transcription factor ComK
MKTLKHIIGFSKSDWKHVKWLTGRMIKNFMFGSLDDAREDLFWIKMHCIYSGKQIKKEDDNAN